MKKFYGAFLLGAFCILTFCIAGCDFNSAQQKLVVTATAYNSVEAQTSQHPFLTAWGYTLKPDDKVIAISRDLMTMGMTNGTPVHIEGLEGEYIVRDKMNKRFKKRIDIYMGLDVQKALKWGKKKVTISWKKN
ncbi:MAG: 3D domain-containing protein [Desulfovibrio sp.]